MQHALLKKIVEQQQQVWYVELLSLILQRIIWTLFVRFASLILIGEWSPSFSVLQGFF